jgi:hypothetical protein
MVGGGGDIIVIGCEDVTLVLIDEVVGFLEHSEEC